MAIRAGFPALLLALMPLNFGAHAQAIDAEEQNETEELGSMGDIRGGAAEERKRAREAELEAIRRSM